MASDHALSPELRELADAYGVVTEYTDWRLEHREVPADTIVRVLAALGVDASSPAGAEAALAEIRFTPWRRVLPPAVIAREGEPLVVTAHVPLGGTPDAVLRLEDGGVVDRLAGAPTIRMIADLDGVQTLAAAWELPGDLPLGWHELVVTYGEGVTASAPVAVTPAFLGVPAPGRVWGAMVQLYSVRSHGSWGAGDLHDLGELARWSAGQGAGLLLVNPLHACCPVPPVEPSPYFPATRRYVNPLYLRLEDLPEYAAAPAADRERVDRLGDDPRATDHDAAGIDRDLAWRHKLAALEILTEVRTPAREAAYDEYVAAEGQALEDFATWCALCEAHGRSWHDWPAELRDPRSGAVAAERARLADRVDLYRRAQWLLGEQLAGVQAAAVAAGMPLGIVHDLAVGVSPDGADAWALQDVLALGVTVGAPPDAFNQQGQDWRQPPWHPTRLADAAYRPFRDLVRGLLRHGGGLRVDHVLGLFRLWWIPDGSSPFDGTYVRYDHDALVGILALEAHRAGAVVIGEDLGTVDPAARGVLADRGILGTSVLWFERDGAGAPLAAERWRELCLATVNTHDLPPTAGYLAGDHVDLRERLGLLTRPVEEERAADAADRGAWLGELVRAGLLTADEVAAGGTPAGAERVVAALHAYLTRTPARLLGVALTDAVGDRRTQNQPGTVDEYPNWRVPLTGPDGSVVLLEDVLASDRVAHLFRAVDAAVRAPK